MRYGPRLAQMAVMLALVLAASRAPGRTPSGKGAGNPPPDDLPTLTSTAQVHRLSSREAARNYPVHLRAVVTYFDPKLSNGGFVPLFVHDDSGCVFVKTPWGLIRSLPAGTLIDLRGVSDSGEFAPIVAKPRVEVIGFAGLPREAGHPSWVRLLSGVEDGQWVEVEGVVHSIAETDHHVNLELAMADGNIPILMGQGVLADYASLVDARIRVRGNAGPLMDRARRQMIGANIHCPGLFTVETLDPAPRDPFTLSTIPIDSLLHWDMAPLLVHRVHVRGRVTLQWPGVSLCIQDAARGICAQTGQAALVREGDLIDLAGFARAEGSAPVLTDAVFRRAGAEAAVPVPALPTSGEQALLGGFDSQLIQVEGQLISRDLAAADTTLLLSSGKYIYKAVLPPAQGSPASGAWEIGSILRVTGICSVQLDQQRSVLGLGTAVPTAFRVLMRSPADVTVVEKPSWWTPLHAVLLLALAVMGAMVALAWVAALRKRVAQQTSLLRESEERYRYMAQHDSLTGLATRPVLHDRLVFALEAARLHGTGLALLMLDLDKFKQINDTFGHHVGDEVLRVTAARVSGAVRKGDTVARMGGDEFIVLLCDLGNTSIAESIATKLVQILSAPVAFAGVQVRMSASVGVCTAFSGELDAESLLKNVDAALYQAKAEGRNCFQVFTLGLDRATTT
jgi:diguanylate cyclase (GGDEF)-like protein